MKQFLHKTILMTVALATMTACSSSNDDTADSGNNGNTPEEAPINYAASITDLTSLDVAIDRTPLDETETVPTDDEDYIENNKFSKTVNIQFDGTTASVSGNVSGVSVSIQGADVTLTSTAKKVAYTVSGTTNNGYLKIYSENKYSLCLNGVSITNPDGAAINLQSKKRSYIVLADGTTNTLTDGTAYTDETAGEDMKAALFCEGKMLFSGKGSLLVNAHCKAGIRSDAYIQFRPGCNVYVNATAGNGIKANDAIYVKGGVINVETSAATAKAISCDGEILVSGGRTTAITTGDARTDADGLDASGCAAVKTDSVLNINGGSLLCKSTGTGGKGINAQQGISVTQGTLRVVTTGNRFDDGTHTVSATGIKSDGDITLGHADIMVRATGGKDSEGIESKTRLTVTDGKLQVYSHDHALCASSSLTVSGGYTFAMSTEGYGFHAGGAISLSGGVAIGCGSPDAKAGFYSADNNWAITGGTVLALGGTASAPNNGATTQPVVMVNADAIQSGTFITVADSTCLLAFKAPADYTQGCAFMASSPLLTQGHSYTVSRGAAVTGGTDFCGYVTDGTVSGGTAWCTLALNNIINTWTKE